MALEGGPQQRQLVLRFDPTTLSETLALVDERLRTTAPQAALRLRQALHALGPLRSEESMASAILAEAGGAAGGDGAEPDPAAIGPRP